MLSNKSFEKIKFKAVEKLIGEGEINKPPSFARDQFGRNSASQGYNSGFMNNKGRPRYYFETQLLVALIASTVIILLFKPPDFILVVIQRSP